MFANKEKYTCVHIYFFHLCEHMYLHTWTIHPILSLCPTLAPPTLYLAYSLSAWLNNVEWMTLAAWNVKKHMVTKALDMKQFFFSKWLVTIIWNLTGSDSQPRVISSPSWMSSGHLVTSGNIFGGHSWGGPAGIYWVEAINAAKQPSKHRTDLPLPHRESPGSKCQ